MKQRKYKRKHQPPPKGIPDNDWDSMLRPIQFNFWVLPVYGGWFESAELAAYFSAYLPPRASAGAIPNEILDLILDFLLTYVRDKASRSPRYMRIYKRQLSQCALTCRRWAELSRPLMFHTIILQSAADVDGLLSLTRMSQQDQWRGPIATYIQKLWIVERGSSWAHEFFLQIGSKLVKLAELGYFNHLATMNQSSHTHPVVLQFIKSNFRSVQSFTLFQQHFGSFVDLARLVGTLRNIRVLSCEQVTWDNSAREPRSFMASTLETVYIKKCTAIWPFFWIFTARPHTANRRPKFTLSDGSAMLNLLRCFCTEFISGRLQYKFDHTRKYWKFSLSIGEHEPTDWELVSDSPNVQFGVVSYTHPRHEADDASVTSLLLRDHRFATTSDLVNLIVKLRDLESLECHGIYWDEQSDDRPVIHTSGKLSTITVSGSQEFWPMIWLLVGCEEDPQQAHGTFAGPILPSVDIAAITGILRSFYLPEISKATFRRIHSSCPSAEWQLFVDITGDNFAYAFSFAIQELGDSTSSDLRLCEVTMDLTRKCEECMQTQITMSQGRMREFARWSFRTQETTTSVNQLCIAGGVLRYDTQNCFVDRLDVHPHPARMLCSSHGSVTSSTTSWPKVLRDPNAATMDDWAQGRQEPKATARPHRFSPDVITLRYCSNSTIQVVAYGGSGPARTGIFKSAPYSPEELEPIFKNVMLPALREGKAKIFVAHGHRDYEMTWKGPQVASTGGSVSWWHHSHTAQEDKAKERARMEQKLLRLAQRQEQRRRR